MISKENEQNLWQIFGKSWQKKVISQQKNSVIFCNYAISLNFSGADERS